MKPMADKKLKDREEEIILLVRDAKLGNTDAFAKLYDYYVNPIYRYVYYKVNREDALDITESIFLKIWENLKSYRKIKGTFSSWVFKIAHNLIVDHYRLQRQYIPIDDLNLPDEKRESDPSARAQEALDQENLKRALSQLKKKYQQIILLRYVNDLELSEIAKIMKKSEGSLRVLKFRALQALRKVFESMNITY